MSTSALVGIKEKGRNALRIQAIYVHRDGGLWDRGVGQTLLKHYNTVYKVKSLLSFGDCSELNESPESSVFYERDRGEDSTATRAETYTLADWELFVEQSGHDYFYVWDGEWTVRTPSTGPVALATAIAHYQSTAA